MKKTYQKDSDIYLRFAENEDKIDLLNWRNELETRKASFNTEKIDQKDHERWFNNSIKNKKRNIFIICDKNCNKLGQIRFDRGNDTAEVDISLNPKYRNLGVGSLALSKGANRYINNFNINILVARVKSNNIASVKALQKAGFKIYKK